MPADRDPELESLRDELRAQLAALNELYHPVYPAAPARVAELETRIRQVRESISARRRELIPA
ncbi:hypothetical protein LBMAG53_26820 [Planctomycetota bacterium]|nr:hypothetical protein LBMAG53_26820 [Planctomycetota bacterium]